MREETLRIKRRCLIASAVLAALFCAFYLALGIVQARAAAELREASVRYQQVLGPLWSRQSTLEKDLRDLELKFKRAQEVSAAGSTQSGTLKGSVAVMLTDIDASLEDVVLPEMRRQRIVGMLALSEFYFPGNEGCLSMDKVRSLLDEGWTLAMTVGETTDIQQLYQRFTDSGLPKPEVVYCTASATEPMRASFRELGLNVLVRRAESMITEDACYFAQCLGSNEVAAPQRLQEISGTQNYLLFTIGTIYDRDKCPDPGAMFMEIKQGLTDGILQVIRPTGNNLEHCVVRSILSTGNEAQLKTLQTNLTQQLEDVNQQIMRAIGPRGSWVS